MAGIASQVREELKIVRNKRLARKSVRIAIVGRVTEIVNQASPTKVHGLTGDSFWQLGRVEPVPELLCRGQVG